LGTEIERKFLIVSEAWRTDAMDSVKMTQGYIAETEFCSIRIRVAGERAWLNIKEMKLGMRRGEFEYPVPAEEGQDMLRRFCVGGLIEKVRHQVRHGDHVWEIDEFAGSNLGLILAEVELSSVDERIDLPPWVGEEVTDDSRYYNIKLAQFPYLEW
jgi:adenylate cyclase